MFSESGHRSRQLLMLHLQGLGVNSKLAVEVLHRSCFAQLIPPISLPKIIQINNVKRLLRMQIFTTHSKCPAWSTYILSHALAQRLQTCPVSGQMTGWLAGEQLQISHCCLRSVTETHITSCQSKRLSLAGDDVAHRLMAVFKVEQIYTRSSLQPTEGDLIVHGRLSLLEAQWAYEYSRVSFYDRVTFSNKVKQSRYRLGVAQRVPGS